MISYYFTAKESPIHGKGVFVKRPILRGTEFPLTYFIRTEPNQYTIETSFGYCEPYYTMKYLNHSDSPNAEVYEDGDRIILVLLEDVDKDDEITFNYS